MASQGLDQRTYTLDAYPNGHLDASSRLFSVHLPLRPGAVPLLLAAGRQQRVLLLACSGGGVLAFRVRQRGGSSSSSSATGAAGARPRAAGSAAGSEPRRAAASATPRTPSRGGPSPTPARGAAAASSSSSIQSPPRPLLSGSRSSASAAGGVLPAARQRLEVSVRFVGEATLPRGVVSSPRCMLVLPAAPRPGERADLGQESGVGEDGGGGSSSVGGGGGGGGGGGWSDGSESDDCDDGSRGGSSGGGGGDGWGSMLAGMLLGSLLPSPARRTRRPMPLRTRRPMSLRVAVLDEADALHCCEVDLPGAGNEAVLGEGGWGDSEAAAAAAAAAAAVTPTPFAVAAVAQGVAQLWPLLLPLPCGSGSLGCAVALYGAPLGLRIWLPTHGGGSAAAGIVAPPDPLIAFDPEAQVLGVHPQHLALVGVAQDGHGGIRTSLQPLVPAVLLALFTCGDGAAARAHAAPLVRAASLLPAWQRCCELLLVAAAEATYAGGAAAAPVLGGVVALLRDDASFSLALARALRSCEPSRAPLLLAHAGAPAALFDGALAAGQLDAASAYLLTLGAAASGGGAPAGAGAAAARELMGRALLLLGAALRVRRLCLAAAVARVAQRWGAVLRAEGGDAGDSDRLAKELGRLELERLELERLKCLI